MLRCCVPHCGLEPAQRPVRYFLVVGYWSKRRKVRLFAKTIVCPNSRNITVNRACGCKTRVIPVSLRYSWYSTYVVGVVGSGSGGVSRQSRWRLGPRRSPSMVHRTGSRIRAGIAFRHWLTRHPQTGTRLPGLSAHQRSGKHKVRPTLSRLRLAAQGTCRLGSVGMVKKRARCWELGRSGEGSTNQTIFLRQKNWQEALPNIKQGDRDTSFHTARLQGICLTGIAIADSANVNFGKELSHKERERDGTQKKTSQSLVKRVQHAKLLRK
jgi:hypothetical protein